MSEIHETTEQDIIPSHADMASNVGATLPPHVPATIGDLTALADSMNNLFSGTVTEIHNMIGEQQKHVIGLVKRLDEIEKFLPILGEQFAGKIGGTSEESAAILASFENADADALKAAVEEITATKAETQPVEEIPDHIMRARKLEGLV